MLFNQQHIKHIAEKVMLCDPAGNMLQVGVKIRNYEAYFVNGWIGVGKFYGLEVGCWFRIVFIASNMFLITIRDRLDQPVNYPFPPKVSFLGYPPTAISYPRNVCLANNDAYIFKKPDFYHTLQFNLTYSDIVSGFLVNIYMFI